MPEDHNYICNRCGVEFTIQYELDEGSRPVCTPCFKHITAATSDADYNQRIKPIENPTDGQTG